MSRIDQSELDKIEQRAFHLSVLASVFVLVLAGGVALLMYPAVFVHPDERNKWSLYAAFFGFCVLSVLFVWYLLDRNRAVGKLKRSLVEELERNFELRLQANADLLHSMPDLNHFQDQILIEFRRASNMTRPLSVIFVKLQLSIELKGEKEQSEVLGEASKAIWRSLRPTDSIYLLGHGLFGFVLPDTDQLNASRYAQQVEETLKAVGGPGRFSVKTITRNYPEHVQSAHELEEVVSSLLPEKEPWAEVYTSR